MAAGPGFSPAPKQTELISGFPLASELCPSLLLSLSFYLPKMYVSSAKKTERVDLPVPGSGPHYSVATGFAATCFLPDPLPSPWSLFSFVSLAQGRDWGQAREARRVMPLRQRSLMGSPKFRVITDGQRFPKLRILGASLTSPPVPTLVIRVILL